MELRLTTAGESHGPGLTCILEGLPAGLRLTPEDLDRDLARRQLGHGRGGRMKIEQDRAIVTAGIRHGRTLGGPIALQVNNRDYANWEERMNPWPVEADVPEVHLPRPGHADLVGTQKYNTTDVRDILERASARETAARVAGGAVARQFLRELGVEIRSHVVSIGDVFALGATPGSAAHDEIFWNGSFVRETNHAGGIEGGMTTGDPLVARSAMKPLPTLTKPLRSVDIDTHEPAEALRERTDSCTVPAAGVVGEAMVAFVLASAYIEKFGGDHIDDTRAALAAYEERIAWRRD